MYIHNRNQCSGAFLVSFTLVKSCVSLWQEQFIFLKRFLIMLKVHPAITTFGFDLQIASQKLTFATQFHLNLPIFANRGKYLEIVILLSKKYQHSCSDPQKLTFLLFIPSSHLFSSGRPSHCGSSSLRKLSFLHIHCRHQNDTC